MKLRTYFEFLQIEMCETLEENHCKLIFILKIVFSVLYSKFLDIKMKFELPYYVKHGIHWY